MRKDNRVRPHEQSHAEEQGSVYGRSVKFTRTDQAKANGVQAMVQIKRSHLLLDIEQVGVPRLVEESGGILTVVDPDRGVGDSVLDTELGAAPAREVGCLGQSLWHRVKV